MITNLLKVSVNTPDSFLPNLIFSHVIDIVPHKLNTITINPAILFNV